MSSSVIENEIAAIVEGCPMGKHATPPPPPPPPLSKYPSISRMDTEVGVGCRECVCHSGLLERYQRVSDHSPCGRG